MTEKHKLRSSSLNPELQAPIPENRNMTELTDSIISNRTQKFEYDIMNRLTKAVGKYGTETYGYTDNGNMTKRGSTNLTYGDANHIHAVTQSLTEPGNTMNYAYDASGNMTDRNGDILKYDTSGRMIEMNTVSGDKAEYSYDSSGKRVRKKITSSSGTVSQTVYNIEDAYEITKEPGKAEKHTLYFKGAKGDLVAQMTREDAVLVGNGQWGIGNGEKRLADCRFSIADCGRSIANSECFDCASLEAAAQHKWRIGSVMVSPSNHDIRRFADAVFSGNIFFADCSGIAVNCKEYRENRIIYSIKRIALFVLHPKNRELREALLWSGVMVLVLLILGFGAQGLEFGGFELQTPSSKLRAPLAGMLLVSILFQFTSCVGKRSSKDGTPPWILMQSGVNGDTVSISQPGYVPGGSSGFGAQGLVRGMFFLHQDHLGSVTMVTDGAGNVVSGGSMGGKANYHYRPYGEIDRMNSSGPDITKFKYTGQEEDKESGLYYYKARYYDASLGRFNSADSLIMPESIQGMNRYMYVEGNPIRYNDPTGHKLTDLQSWAIMGYLTGPMAGFTREEGAIIGGTYGRKRDYRNKQRSGGNHLLNETADWTPVLSPLNPFRTLYNRYYSHHSLKKGLNDKEKMAAAGYMLNGAEGAAWGYLVGTLKDQKRFINRKKNLKDNTEIGVFVITLAVGLGMAAAELTWEKMFEQLFYQLAKEGPKAVGNAVLAAFGTEIASKAFENSLEPEPYTSMPLTVCTVALAHHLDSKPNIDAENAIDAMCLISAGSTNK